MINISLVGVWVSWELRRTLGPRLQLYMGLIKEEEFTFCLRAAETSRSSATGGFWWKTDADLCFASSHRFASFYGNM